MAEEKDETINKLITALAQQSSLLGLGSEKHGEEAIELKRQWFIQVASSLEKTNRALESINLAVIDLQKSFHLHQLDVKTELAKLKDFVNVEIKEINSCNDNDYEKLVEKLEGKLNKINEKLEAITTSISKIKEDNIKDFAIFKDRLVLDEIKPLGDKVINIYIRVMVLSTVAGIIASAVLTVILAFIKG